MVGEAAGQTWKTQTSFKGELGMSGRGPGPLGLQLSSLEECGGLWEFGQPLCEVKTLSVYLVGWKVSGLGTSKLRLCYLQMTWFC